MPDVSTDKRYVAARPQTRSEIATPLMLQGRVFGVFNLESEHVDAYHEGHLEMLAAFGLIRYMSGIVPTTACIIELTFLNGRKRLDVTFSSLVAYDS